MSYQKQSFGMMDEGYFVSRTQILDWINNLLDLNLSKIQQLGSGAVYCQIMDVIHPGKVAMSRIKWNAKNDYEFISNLKVLQNAFDKAGIKRYVQVEKLAKAKYQDNLEFIQWLKRYYDLNCGDRGNNYNAQQRRGANTKLSTEFAEKNVIPKTFNAGGQMIEQKAKELPGSKTPQVLPNKSNLVSQSKPPVSSASTKKIEAPTRKQEKKATNSSTKTQPQSNFEKLYKAQADKNKDLTIKLAMIQEIVRSEQDSLMKMKMLQEVLGVEDKGASQEVSNSNTQQQEQHQQQYQQKSENTANQKKEQDQDAY